MKSFLMLAFGGLFFSTLHAQTEQTLFHKSKIRGGFGGPMFTYGQVKGNRGFGAGGGGGMVFDQTMIGAFGHGEVFSIQREGMGNGSLALGYGGLWLGYSIPTRKAVHSYASVKIGAGGVGISDRDIWWEDDGDFEEYDAALLVIMPEAGVELNLCHWMRMVGTVGYRYVDGFQGALGLDSKAFNAPVFGLTLRFGWFGHRAEKSETPER